MMAYPFICVVVMTLCVPRKLHPTPGNICDQPKVNLFGYISAYMNQYKRQVIMKEHVNFQFVCRYYYGCCEAKQLKIRFIEAATGGVLQKKLFLETLQNSQENTYVGVSF